MRIGAAVLGRHGFLICGHVAEVAAEECSGEGSVRGVLVPQPASTMKAIRATKRVCIGRMAVDENRAEDRGQ